RRRHTRFSRDWSSDVCSSDLLEDLALAVPGKVELDRLDTVGAVLLLGLRLGETDRRDLRLAVGDARDARLDDGRRVQPGDLLGDEDALLEAAVRELEPRDDVADGVDVRHAGVQTLVGEHEAAVHRDALLLVAQALGGGTAA